MKNPPAPIEKTLSEGSAQNIEELRGLLFEELRSLRDTDKPNIDRAFAVVNVAQTLINSVKVEIDMIKALNTNNTLTSFMKEAQIQIDSSTHHVGKIIDKEQLTSKTDKKAENKVKETATWPEGMNIMKSGETKKEGGILTHRA